MEHEGKDFEVIFGKINQCENEPLAGVEMIAETRGKTAERVEETDIDGITLAVRRARYEREVAVNSCMVSII